jgi:hypothetical protein
MTFDYNQANPDSLVQDMNQKNKTIKRWLVAWLILLAIICTCIFWFTFSNRAPFTPIEVKKIDSFGNYILQSKEPFVVIKDNQKFQSYLQKNTHQLFLGNITDNTRIKAYTMQVTFFGYTIISQTEQNLEVLIDKDAPIIISSNLQSKYDLSLLKEENGKHVLPFSMTISINQNQTNFSLSLNQNTIFDTKNDLGICQNQPSTNPLIVDLNCNLKVESEDQELSYNLGMTTGNKNYDLVVDQKIALKLPLKFDCIVVRTDKTIGNKCKSNKDLSGFSMVNNKKVQEVFNLNYQDKSYDHNYFTDHKTTEFALAKNQEFTIQHPLQDDGLWEYGYNYTLAKPEADQKPLEYKFSMWRNTKELKFDVKDKDNNTISNGTFDYNTIAFGNKSRIVNFNKKTRVEFTNKTTFLGRTSDCKYVFEGNNITIDIEPRSFYLFAGNPKNCDKVSNNESSLITGTITFVDLPPKKLEAHDDKPNSITKDVVGKDLSQKPYDFGII